MSVHNDLGREGEAIAKRFLLDLGYETLDENWIYQKAEIDLICLYESVIVFVEVKTRHSSLFGTPDTFVDDLKIKHLTRAAEAYLQIVDFHGEIRFDIVSILYENEDKYKLSHIKDAFWNYE